MTAKYAKNPGILFNHDSFQAIIYPGKVSTILIIHPSRRVAPRGGRILLLPHKGYWRGWDIRFEKALGRK
jgi:hypothetical protein